VALLSHYRTGVFVFIFYEFSEACNVISKVITKKYNVNLNEISIEVTQY